MKLIKNTLLATALLSALTANAQFTATGSTRVSAGGSPSDRLFSDVGNTVLAPVGTIVWWVADTGLNGVPTSPVEGSILGGDDVLLFQDVVDGSILGATPGRYTRNFSNGTGANGPAVPEVARNANIIFYLWDATSVQTVPTTSGFYTPVAGDTFGVVNLGNVNEIVGSTPWDILVNVNNQTFTVAAVPEPSTYAMMLLGGLGVLGYRRFKK